MNHSLREKVATAIDIVYRTNYLSRNSGGLHQLSHAGQKIVRRERLHTELHFESGVLRLSIFQTADDHDWQPGVGPAKPPDKLRAIHSRHNVIGNHQLDIGSESATLKLVKCLFGIEHRDGSVSRASQNRLSGGRLHCIVIDKKDGYGHAASIAPRRKVQQKSIKPYPFEGQDRKHQDELPLKSTCVTPQDSWFDAPSHA
jgi:hypothetical protein